MLRVLFIFFFRKRPESKVFCNVALIAVDGDDDADVAVVVAVAVAVGCNFLLVHTP